MASLEEKKEKCTALKLIEKIDEERKSKRWEKFDCEDLRKMIRGDVYFPLNKKLLEARAEARALFAEFNEFHQKKPDAKKMQEQLGELFGGVEGPAYIEPNFKCDYGFNIFFGKNVYMNYDCIILDCSIVKIGDYSLFGPGVHIYTAAHTTDPEERIKAVEYALPVVIGDNVWIGGGVIIMPGITIGRNSVIGAGSVVTRDIPENVVAVGNPCNVVKKVKDFEVRKDVRYFHFPADTSSS